MNGITVHSIDSYSFGSPPGLRGLLENDDPWFLRSDLVPRVRRILTVLILAEDIESFAENARRGWRFHRLSGDRKHEWSVWVSGN